MSKKILKKEPVAKNSLQIRDFSMAFGENILFSNFDYDFAPGIYAFSGPSGVGKSTLMRIIAGLENRYTGDIILNGEKMTSYSPEIHLVQKHDIIVIMLLFMPKDNTFKNSKKNDGGLRWIYLLFHFHKHCGKWLKCTD